MLRTRDDQLHHATVVVWRAGSISNTASNKQKSRLETKLVKRWGQTDFRELEPLVEVEVTFYFISTGVIVVDKDDTDTALSLSLSHLNGRYEGQKGRLPPHRIELWTFRLLGERSATEP